jgi:hypothetical protein
MDPAHCARGIRELLTLFGMNDFADVRGDKLSTDRRHRRRKTKDDGHHG